MSVRTYRTILTVFLAAFLTVDIIPAAAQASENGTVPVYPGAVAAVRPAQVGIEAPPPQAKTYVTPDSFTTVKAWYRARLNGAQEVQQPGMETSEDAFLVGTAESGTVVLIQRYNDKTWIVIGPPV